MKRKFIYLICFFFFIKKMEMYVCLCIYSILSVETESIEL